LVCLEILGIESILQNLLLGIFVYRKSGAYLPKFYVILKILCSELSEVPNNLVPEVKLFTCLGVEAYLILNKKPNFSKGSRIKILT